MGIQTAPADKEVPGIQGGCSVIDNPLWILVPWAVFAVALAFKVLKFGKALKRHLTAQTPSIDQFRQSLERIWVQEQRE